MPAVPLPTKPNRLYFYLLRPDGEPGAFQWIASANGFLPSLWRVLLADGGPSPELRRVLLSDAESWIAVDAALALARFRSFTDLVLRHPDIDRVDGLRRYLAAADRYLEASIVHWQPDPAMPPWFCVNPASLPSPDPAITTPPDHLFELRQFREDLDRVVRDGDVFAIDELLGFPQRNLRFTDWKAWSGMFGLAQLEPEYFSGAFRGPYAGDYADHDYDELGSAPDLGQGCERFKSAGLWGVRDNNAVVLQAKWDRVLRTGMQSLVWIQHGDRFGLASIAGDDRGRMLRKPDLDEVHAFVAGLARVRVGATMGLLSADGSWLLRPAMDEIYAYAHGFAVVRSQGRFGYIDAAGITVVEPAFEEADDFTADGVARVRIGARCGLIRSDGTFAVPPEFAAVEWSEDFCGWQCERKSAEVDRSSTERAVSSCTLVHANGSAWIETGWDAIEVFVPGHLIRVRRGERYGLQRWTGATLLDCDFDELLTRDTYGAGPISAHAKNQGKKSPVRTQRLRRPAVANSLEVIARRDGLVGMIGSDGEQLIPFEFSYIDALEPHIENEQRLVTPGLMRVLSVPGRAAPRVGVWDIVARRCVVPCEYDFIWTALLGIDATYGFIVGNRNPKRGCSTKGKYRVGLLHADGSVLVPQEYAWIGECTPLNRDDAMADLRSTLYHYWSRGEPVRASVGEHGPMVGLAPPVQAASLIDGHQQMG